MPSEGGSAPGSDLDLQWPVILPWPLCVQRPSGSWSLEHRPCPGHRGGRAGAGGCPGSSRWWWWGSGKCSAAHGGGSQLSLRPGAQAPLTSSACPVRAGAVPLGEHHMFARALGPPAMRIWLLQSLVGLQVGSGPPPCSLARGGGGDGLL